MGRVSGKDRDQSPEKLYHSRIDNHRLSTKAIREYTEWNQKKNGHRAPHCVYQVYLEDGGSKIECKEYCDGVTHGAEAVLY